MAQADNKKGSIVLLRKRWYIGVIIAAVAGLPLFLTNMCRRGDVLDPFASYEYFESARPEIGSRTLLIQADGTVELNTISGNVTLDVYTYDDVEQTVAELKEKLSKLPKDSWNQQYVKVGAPWFKRLIRRHPEGVSELEYHIGADAPQDVVEILEKFNKLVEQVKASGADNAPPA